MDRDPDRLTALDLTAELSETELKIARSLICGRSNSEIGAEIDRAEDTVKTALRKTFQKTGATTRAALVTWMYESGHVIPGAEDFPGTPVRPAVLVRAAEPLLTTITSDDPAQVPRIRRRIVEARGDLARAMASLGNL
ncbi:hypothetical protein GCM10027271_01530 [Saccharopolyspora gloriosae]|uniref:DNA-binding CsgD family transcriptional regulator n=1 Tax=Saccharopolyspora gloriosae TaxID=455344 RepID=A0A840NF85_9PSEU|nr:helix-turn-helix transcriptional regulator [Saccharopolyspora gloriosae]MBB5070580.1 DNA-binding CsgD family transcriptional regulator [Saccharopolyspora gloriosae]